MLRSSPMHRLNNRILFVLFCLFGLSTDRCHSSNDIFNADACCKLGQRHADINGHCQNIDGTLEKKETSITETETPNSHLEPFTCQLTAKMCCIKFQQDILCQRTAKEIVHSEIVDNYLNALLKNSSSSDANRLKGSGSPFPVSQYLCDVRRNNDALCCISCNLGLVSIFEQISSWKQEQLTVNLPWLSANNWCQIAAQNATKVVQESQGFVLCCNQVIQELLGTFKWCQLKPAPCSHRCHETRSIVRPFQCTCYDGYRLAEDSKTCVDVDECEELTHNCDQNHELCHNTDGGFQCLPDNNKVEPDTTNMAPYTVNLRSSNLLSQNCSKGYYFNISESRCKDIDECRFSLHNCNLKKQVCRNLLGSYICLNVGQNCPSGFRQIEGNKKNSTGCVDVDECEDKSYDCDEQEEYCENFIGSYTCEMKFVSTAATTMTTETTTFVPITTTLTPNSGTNCQKGYRFVKFSFQCEDIDECRIGQHNCDLSKQNCINFHGSYSCVDIGNTRDNEINSNHNQPKSLSNSAAVSLSSARLTSISCSAGFDQNEELNICEDVDECKFLVYPCPGNSFCQNTVGSYVCHCKFGFMKKDGISNECVDIDECQTGLSSCYGSLKCVNRPGSFDCVTETHSSKSKSVTIVSSPGKPLERSHSSASSSSSKCPDDQIYDHVLKRCMSGGGMRELEERIDNARYETNHECLSGERIVNGECQQIKCGIGFFYNHTQKRCQDMNECLLNKPCTPEQKCTNTIGSYRCTIRCNIGYQDISSGLACEDIDECKSPNTHSCPPNQQCRNLPGNYVCECPPGFTDPSSNGTCVDLDECEKGEMFVCDDYKSQRCVNTLGSYRCVCKNGFDEVTMEPNKGSRCVDIDECSDKSKNKCQHLCYNYGGSYKCACRSGYELTPDGFRCVDIDECYHYQVNKTGRSDQRLCYHLCVNVPGSFKCICPPGYESQSDGQICKDIDECELNSDLCPGQHEYCLNVRGSYQCNQIDCLEGYYFESASKKCIQHMERLASFDLSKPMSYSHNYLSLVSNVRIPDKPGYLDLVAMSGPAFSVAGIKFDLRLINAKTDRQDVRVATADDFFLRRPEYNRIIVSLLNPLEGPQNVKLELTVRLYEMDNMLGGSTKAIIYIVVSEYEF